MEIEDMKFWHNELGFIKDIDQFPYKIDNIIIAAKDFSTACGIHIVYSTINDEDIDITGLHLVTEIPDQYGYVREYPNGLCFKYKDLAWVFNIKELYKTYIIFDSESDMIKWKLKI